MIKHSPEQITLIDPNFFFRLGVANYGLECGSYEVASQFVSIDRYLESPGSTELVVIGQEDATLDWSTDVGLLHRLGVRVVVVSDRYGLHDALAALEHGACAVLRRSCEGAELAQALASVAAGAIYLATTFAPKVLGVSTKGADRIQLTDRELAVLRLVADGYSDAEIATELSVAVSTARSHLGL